MKVRYIAITDIHRNKRKPWAEGDYVKLDAGESSDPDGNILSFHWFYYREAGDCMEEIEIDNSFTETAGFKAPPIPRGKNCLTLHIILEVKDNGKPPLTRYQRIIVTVVPQDLFWPDR